MRYFRAMQFDDEYFGTPAHVALARRTRDLYRLLADDPRYGSYGRNIILLGDQGAGTAKMIAAASRLVGGAGVHYYPAVKAEALLAGLTGLGQDAGCWQHCSGGRRAYELCRAIVADAPLPPDLQVVRLSADSPAGLVRATAELSMECGVAPLPGKFMRGLANPGLCLVAVDADGAPVATGASYRYTHPDSAYPDYAFWGALATRPDRRGEKLAMILGAMAIVHMWEVHGVCGFSTGIKADNAASMAVCARQGVVPGDWAFVACTDPVHFKGVTFTR